MLSRLSHAVGRSPERETGISIRVVTVIGSASRGTGPLQKARLDFTLNLRPRPPPHLLEGLIEHELLGAAVAYPAVNIAGPVLLSASLCKGPSLILCPEICCTLPVECIEAGCALIPWLSLRLQSE